jgi:hypothetical protein
MYSTEALKLSMERITSFALLRAGARTRGWGSMVSTSLKWAAVVLCGVACSSSRPNSASDDAGDDLGIVPPDAHVGDSGSDRDTREDVSDSSFSDAAMDRGVPDGPTPDIAITDTSRVDGDAGSAHPVPVCHGDGEWSFHTFASSLIDLEGRAVWGSAVQPGGPDSPMGTIERRVVVVGVISGGAFDLTCERGLTTTFYYPSAATVIDTDASGDCTDDDLVITTTFFGWANDVHFTTETWLPWQTVRATQESGLALPGLCGYYFPAGP